MSTFITSEQDITARLGLIDLGPAPCPGCGQECPSFNAFGLLRYDCPGCAAAEKTRRVLDARRLDCLRLWLDVTPLDMQEDVDRSRLAPYVVPALDLNGSHGVGLCGGTGGGKTRVAFTLLKRAANHGLKPWAITGAKLRQAAANRYADNRDIRAAAQETLHRTELAQVVLIDDIGKGASTPTGDETLYDILNERRDNRRITFWTANGGGEWLIQKLGRDFGPAIVRRLADLAGGREGGRIFVEPPKPKT